MRIPLTVAAATLLMSYAALAQSPAPGTTPRATPNTAPSATPGQGLGQSPSQSQSPSTGQSQGQSNESVRAHIQQNLQAAGFTDIRIMHSSFLVRAKDRDGNPVMLVINPDSITAVEAGPQQGGNQPSATGSGDPNQNSNPTNR
jgi:hypothetical protein